MFHCPSLIIRWSLGECILMLGCMLRMSGMHACGAHAKNKKPQTVSRHLQRPIQAVPPAVSSIILTACCAVRKTMPAPSLGFYTPRPPSLSSLHRPHEHTSCGTSYRSTVFGSLLRKGKVWSCDGQPFWCEAT